MTRLRGRRIEFPAPEATALLVQEADSKRRHRFSDFRYLFESEAFGASKQMRRQRAAVVVRARRRLYD
jgi:hypothetical protein